MFLELCKRCKGCCLEAEDYRDVILGKNDLKSIPKKFIKKVDRLWRFKKNKKDVCYFLTEYGCNLDYETRPLECKIFPMTFRIRNNNIKFYLFADCPVSEKVSKKMIVKMKIDLLNNLKFWQPAEILAYGERKISQDYFLV